MQPLMLDGIEVKVGSRLWSIQTGWGVASLSVDPASGYPIIIGNSSFSRDGKVYKTDVNRSLFWNEVTITPPAPPKKKVKVWDWFVLFCFIVATRGFAKSFTRKA